MAQTVKASLLTNWQEVEPNCVTGEKDATREEEYEVSPAVPAAVDADGKEAHLLENK
jgi:hypothetical protein